MIEKLSKDRLEQKFLSLSHSPKDFGTIELIVSRPSIGERQILKTAQITKEEGLIGDNWKERNYKGGPNLQMQITLMNSKVIEAIAGDSANWPPAGDQLFVDLDLSVDNLPVGQNLSIGSESNVILEISKIPHTGCSKFSSRYGRDAALFINASERKYLRLRGLNAKVIKSGIISVNDIIKKI
jgi:MOSC domain-containing protein YiiM